LVNVQSVVEELLEGSPRRPRRLRRASVDRSRRVKSLETLFSGEYMVVY
jgi:hypothetical protein